VSFAQIAGACGACRAWFGRALWHEANLRKSRQLVRDAKIDFMSCDLTPSFSISCVRLSCVPKGKGRGSWKAKVHPAFLEIAKLWGDLRRGTGGNSQEFRDKVRRARDELQRKYPELRPGSSSNHVQTASKPSLSEQDAAVGTLEWLCWRRTGQSLAVLVKEEKAGNLEAHKKVQRVRDDYWRATHARQSLEPFKENPDHCELLELGWNLRLRRLSAEELADCFDELCPCGEVHDPDALKKLRARVRKRFDSAYI